MNPCRGRAYPIPPILNHTGDDLSRGLLVFGEGRPLGDKGFDWLLCQVRSCARYWWCEGRGRGGTKGGKGPGPRTVVVEQLPALSLSFF